MKNSAAKVQIKSLSELMGVPEETEQSKERKIVRLKLKDVHDYKRHTYSVVWTSKMAELYESIKEYGVLEAGTARIDPSGGYECIAGHRRRFCANLAGIEEMDFEIRNVSDDEANIIMADSNIHRSDDEILPSERANSYKLRLESTKKLLKEKNLEIGIRADEAMAKEINESRNTIQRYIRLTELIPELLQLVDERKLPMTTGAELSFLEKGGQAVLYQYMQENNMIPSGQQAVALKEQKEKEITIKLLDSIFKTEKKKPTRIVFNRKLLSQYFPESYGQQEIEEIFLNFLEKWKQENDKKSNTENQIEGQMDIEKLDNGKYMPG